MRDAARLLEVLRDAALHHENLAAALRQSGLRGCERAVARLQAGEPLARAIAGLVPPRTAELLAGELPSLATRAALLADEAWKRAQRRRVGSGWDMACERSPGGLARTASIQRS